MNEKLKNEREVTESRRRVVAHDDLCKENQKTRQK